MEEQKQPSNEAKQPDEQQPEQAKVTEDGMEQQLESVTSERDDFKDKFLRSKAELENYRRRVEKEKSDLLNYGLEGFLKELLPVLDSFDKAVEDRVDGEKESFAEGIEMVRKQLLGVLEKSGLQRLDANGEKFDPNMHQAIQRVEKEDLEEEMVDQEFQKGYLLNGRLLRPSMVTVAVPKES